MKTIYTLVETSKNDLGEWDFRLEPDFQDAVDHWVSEGESREEMEVAVKDCLQSFDLDDKEDTQKVLTHIALPLTSDKNVLREIMDAAAFHDLPFEGIDKYIAMYFTEESEPVKE